MPACSRYPTSTRPAGQTGLGSTRPARPAPDVRARRQASRSWSLIHHHRVGSSRAVNWRVSHGPAREAHWAGGSARARRADRSRSGPPWRPAPPAYGPTASVHRLDGAHAYTVTFKKGETLRWAPRVQAMLIRGKSRPSNPFCSLATDPSPAARLRTLRGDRSCGAGRETHTERPTGCWQTG